MERKLKFTGVAGTSAIIIITFSSDYFQLFFCFRRSCSRRLHLQLKNAIESGKFLSSTPPYLKTLWTGLHP